jgi:hypothetical protein
MRAYLNAVILRIPIFAMTVGLERAVERSGFYPPPPGMQSETRITV